MAFAVVVGWAEGIAAVRNEIMVVATDPPKIEQARLTIRCNRNDMVTFESLSAVTTHHDTRGIAIDECGFQFGRDLASVVTDSTDIDAIRDQNFEECATEKIFACMIDRYRPDARDLTPFTMAQFTAEQSRIIDDHHQIHIRVRLRRTWRCGTRRRWARGGGCCGDR